MTKTKTVGYDLYPFHQPSKITLNEKSAAFTVTYIEPDDNPGWVVKVSSRGATPFLLVDGEALLESVALNEFVNGVTEGDLHLEDALQKAQKPHVGQPQP
ncbi:glutathione S-transferase N-terminal domain-containing protein [Ruegeria sp. ANG-R]|uniref:glutathione S-transferase N-terminal domain-containing protein n=1 Tax=Ruegeria sp. ANG-R TaxID=1577903 RepID=UPI000689EEEC|nr:glutathione S-transferase N-terminal domain-containing protein [Ruegeria sp. ANG-R]